MAKTYKGSLSLEWYNKQKSILIASSDKTQSKNDVPAPAINWVNKEGALFYEVIDEEGKGFEPFWVNSNDIRIKEARPLKFQNSFMTIEQDEPGTLPGTSLILEVVESTKDDASIENILIKGDNLLALNTLKKHFENKPDSEKIKCIYIDPPYNTGVAFENYDDSLAHSEWLTMMRDRLIILRELLQESGTLCVSIDNNESCYLQVLMDSIFGRQNRKNNITLKRGSVTGAKVINPGLVNISEFILVYSKNIDSWEPKRIMRIKERDDRYNSYIENYDDDFINWKFCSLLEAYSKETGLAKKDLKTHFQDHFQNKIDEFVYTNAHKVVQFATLDENSVSKEAVRLKKKSESEPDKIFILEREGKKPYYLYKGKLILFVKDRLTEIDGQLSFSEPVTDIWDDVLPNDLHNEGSVEFRKGKKPEKLLQRIFEMLTNEGDLILDCFGGSGSSFAVAHKLKRKWIGIEIGNHADTHIIPRLKTVLNGTDKSGITKSVNWQGGGSFKYYHLGPSIITQDENGVGDFNWSLGRKFIEESLLLSYDYMLDNSISLTSEQLFQSSENLPTIGVQKIGTKTRVAIFSLNEPNGSLHLMPYKEIMVICKAVTKAFSPEYINIFTNRGVEIAYDSKPDDLDIIKVPHAIFAALEQ
jgi:adenine-specific DNA-methyltransferase